MAKTLPPHVYADKEQVEVRLRLFQEDSEVAQRTAVAHLVVRSNPATGWRDNTAMLFAFLAFGISLLTASGTLDSHDTTNLVTILGLLILAAFFGLTQLYWSTGLALQVAAATFWLDLFTREPRWGTKLI